MGSREWVWRSVAAARRRVPLYFSEEARIARRHRAALIEAIAAPDTTPTHRHDLLRRFARHYTTDASIAQLAKAIAASGLTSRVKTELDQAEPATDLGRLSVRLDETLEPPAPSQPLQVNADHAVLIVSSVADLAGHAAPESGPTDWTVIVADDRIADGLRKAVMEWLPRGARVTFIAALLREAQPYQPLSRTASDMADMLAARVVDALPDAGWPEAALPDALRPVLELRLSDTFHRPFQTVLATRRVLDTERAETSAILCLDPALAPALTGSPSTPPSPMMPPRHQMTRALDQTRRQIARAIAHRVRHSGSDSGPRIALAYSERWPTYAQLIGRVSDRLSADYSLTHWPVWGEEMRRRFRRPVPSLTQAISLRTGNETDHLGDALETALARALDTFPDIAPHVPPRQIFPVLRPAVRDGAQPVLGLGVFYEAARGALSGQAPKAILTVPGRNVEVMTIAAAGRDLGLPVIDIQGLMVSDMPRYRLPVADRFLVMNETARDTYVRSLGADPDRVVAVGSVTADADVEAVQAQDPAAMKSALGFAPTARVVTYGLQPLPEETLARWAMAAAEALDAQSGVGLCLKLHPAQPASTGERLSARIREVHPDLPLHIEATRTFTEVLAATDLLLTHFSNIALIAAAAGVPVLALDDDGKGVDLTGDGVQDTLSSPVDLTQRLCALPSLLASLSPAERDRGPACATPGDGRAIDRIRAVIEEML